MVAMSNVKDSIGKPGIFFSKMVPNHKKYK